MYSDFEEINLTLYYSLCASVLGLLIWCLGPVVDDSRDYGVFRLCLARLTCSAARKYYGIEG